MISDDTICAISTPPGSGGIAVVRLSGPEAIAIASRRWKGAPLDKAPTHSAHLGTLLDSRSEPLDQCVATIFRAPGSYTADDTVEFSIHGSPYIQREAVASLCDAGARLAEPGEYTRRAFAAGHLDLTQAEAVADLIASRSRGAHRLAIEQMRGGFTRRLARLRDQLIELSALLELELDFSEEDVEFASRQKLVDIATQVRAEVSRLIDSFARGAAIKDGIPVAIVGPTNVGKSSLLNALLDDDRAIVSDIHGTTRDTVEDTTIIGDHLFRFIDTAGIRDTAETIEALGIERSRAAITRARVIIKVVDASRPQTDIPLPAQPAPDTAVITVINKTDITPLADTADGRIHLSALTGVGIDALKSALTTIIDGDSTAQSDLLITNERHRQALQAALQSVDRVIDGLTAGISGDLVAQDLRETLHHLGTLTGAITTTDLLSTIFSRFCIGK